MLSDRSYLEKLWRTGVSAVEGQASVGDVLHHNRINAPNIILSVGKAAGAMALAAYQKFGPHIPGLVVTKYDHTPDGLPDSCTVIEAAHPILDENSLRAGRAIQAAIAQIAVEDHVLCLVSGGASALAEMPSVGVTLSDLQALATASISGGLNIAQINARRLETSQIKGGKVFAGLKQCKLTVVALSDVEGDSLGVIGSGLFDCHSEFVPSTVRVQSMLAGSNHIARDRIAALATDVQINAETLYSDIFQAADMIVDTVQHGPPGLYIFGGEPTVVLPENPGKGGRNQSLAVALSIGFAGQNRITALVAGTDGSDGPTDAAGGFVSTGDLDLGAAKTALLAADCYPYLKARGDLFAPGPTGTNVMDIALVLKR